MLDGAGKKRVSISVQVGQQLPQHEQAQRRDDAHQPFGELPRELACASRSRAG